MQTFIPYSSFIESARCLDNKRLGKQRVECHQILNILLGKSNAWKNHPAVRMWRGYEIALQCYTNEMILEWLRRGKNNNYSLFAIPEEFLVPFWLGNDLVHISHQTNLLRKDLNHYSQFSWPDYGIIGYYWPVEPKTKKSQEINQMWVKALK